ncbi:MAG: chalcone isomerase family protein [Rhodocyclaceae bacterium]
MARPCRAHRLQLAPGTPRGKIADERIGLAVLKVWLGEKPVDEALKQALLGR